MNEELLQRDLHKNPEKIGKWDFYNIGATSIKTLREAQIIENRPYDGIESKKVDAILVLRRKVIAIIEYKQPSKFKTRKQQDEAINQEIEVAKQLNAKIIIATDTKDTVWVNVQTGNRIKDEQGQELKYKFDISDDKIPDLLEKISFSIHEKNDQIKPKELVNPTDLARTIWQDIWSVSGATPENCLYTFVELFIFKYLSDLGVLKNFYGFDNLMDAFNSSSSEDVLEMYATTVRPKIKELFPEGKDKTTIINGTIFVSKDQKAVKGYSTVFKKVLEKFKNYGKLEHIDYDFKSQLFESFLKESISKKNWGQFFTPLCVVRAIAEMAKDEIKEGITICDPACGVGKFLLEPIKKHLEDFYKTDKKGIIPKIKLVGYDKGFDKDEQKTIILAKANMLIYFSDLVKDNPNLTQEFAKLFNDSFELKTNSILGTLSEPVENEFDLILTNPPYVMSGSSNLKEEISKDGELKNYYKVNAMGVEGLFMEWIIRALKPSGKAFIIVPDGLFNRQSDKNMRQFILDECYIDGIVSLPLKTFFTTPKKTYILCLTKKVNKKDIQTAPVFTYLASEIGETRDVYRFPMEQDDLKSAVELFSFFKGNKQGFEKFNVDKRCKIQPITFFQDNTEKNWTIDNFWTNQEKIELGVIEESKSIKFEELPDLVDEVVNSLFSLKEELKGLSEKKKSSINFKTFQIGEILDFPKTNSKITKDFCIKNSGNIPVYASSKDATSVLGYIQDNIRGVKYYENCLGWNRNGSVGYVFVRNHRFATNEDHRAMILKSNLSNKMHLLFLKFEIEKQLFKNGFSFMNKCGVDKIQQVFIQIPIDENGNIDIEKQEEIIEKYEYVKELKAKAKEYQDKIKELSVEMSDNTNFSFRNVKISSIFEILGEENLTRSFINTRKGIYPVYSGQIENGGVFGYVNFYKYDEAILTWVTYGNSGHILKREGKFNIGRNNCGLRLINELICLDYIKFVAEPLFISNVKGEKQKSLPQTIVKNIEIPIPILPNGDFDLLTQQEIAEKYQKIEEIKKMISVELDKIKTTEIDFI